MRLSEVGAPVSSPDGNDGELGDDDGSADSGGNFLGGLDSETNVALRITDNNDGLEAGTLTGTGLLLDGLDLHDLVLELGEEEVDNLVLLDGKGVEVDLLHVLDLAGLYETTELGDGLPLLLSVLCASTTRSSAATATATLSTAVTTAAESTASCGCGCCCVCHVGDFLDCGWLGRARDGGCVAAEFREVAAGEIVFSQISRVRRGSWQLSHSEIYTALAYNIHRYT